jgi:hypothetical protein
MSPAVQELRNAEYEISLHDVRRKTLYSATLITLETQIFISLRGIFTSVVLQHVNIINWLLSVYLLGRAHIRIILHMEILRSCLRQKRKTTIPSMDRGVQERLSF